MKSNPKPLPRIACPVCHLSQQWTHQRHCLHCNAPMSNWNVACQLGKENQIGPTVPVPQKMN